MENWRTFNNDKELMLLEVELNKILKEEQTILNDFHKLLEHYSSGGLLLEHNQALLLEKKLSKTRNAKAIQEIKKNPKILNEIGLGAGVAAIGTAGSVASLVGLIMRSFSLFLEKGVEIYLDKFANQELPEEYIARLSSQESVEMSQIDPTQAPSIAGAAGRGQSPDSTELLSMVSAERRKEAEQEIQKYLRRKLPGESEQDFSQRLKDPSSSNMGMVANFVLKNHPSWLRGEATKLKPQEKKIVLAILNLAKGAEDFGNYIQGFLKKLIKNVSTFTGSIINKLCRSQEEAESKKQKVEKAFETLGTLIYCGMMASGIAQLFAKLMNWASPLIMSALPAGYASTIATNITDTFEVAMVTVQSKQAFAAKAEVVDSIGKIKTSLVNAADATMTGQKVEKSIHMPEYIQKIVKAVKDAGVALITETFDLFADCVGKPFGIKNAGEKVVGAAKNAWDKFKGLWNTPTNQNPDTVNNSPIKVAGGIREQRIR